MKKILLLLTLSIFIAQCKQPAKIDSGADINKSDKIYQYSVFTALANKIYDGLVTVSYIKGKGDTGLGTFNGLNGEMIVSEGEVYQLLSNGTVIKPGSNQLTPFAVVKFFENDFSLNVGGPTNYEGLKSHIINNLPSKNTGYAFKIEAKFDWIKCGGAVKQKKPYTKTLSQAIINRPVFEAENISGQLAGFWFPAYIGGVNLAGFHLHFISDDKKFAGHLLDFKASELDVMIDKCSGFDIELPGTGAFDNTVFDLKQGYSQPSK